MHNGKTARRRLKMNVHLRFYMFFIPSTNAKKRERAAPIQPMDGAYSVNDFPQMENRTKMVATIIKGNTKLFFTRNPSVIFLNQSAKKDELVAVSIRFCHPLWALRHGYRSVQERGGYFVTMPTECCADKRLYFILALTETHLIQT